MQKKFNASVGPENVYLNYKIFLHLNSSNKEESVKRIFLMGIMVVMMLATVAMADFKETIHQACTKEFELKAACNDTTGMTQFACENTFSDKLGAFFLQKYGALTTAGPNSKGLNKIRLTHIADWPVIVRRFEIDFKKMIGEDKDKADAAIWLLALPFSYSDGTYSPLGYLYVRGNTSSFSAGTVHEIILQAVNSNQKLGAGFISFVKAFYSGDAELMYKKVADMSHDWPALREGAKNACGATHIKLEKPAQAPVPSTTNKATCKAYSQTIGAVAGAAWTAQCLKLPNPEMVERAEAANNSAIVKLTPEDFRSALKSVSRQFCRSTKKTIDELGYKGSEVEPQMIKSISTSVERNYYDQNCQ